MTRTDIQRTLDDLDDSIRLGRTDLARAKLIELTKRELPRQSLCSVASLARRSGLFNMGIKLLNPVVRSDNRQPSSASEAERAEYAALLIKIGATREASTMLKELDPKRHPETLLYAAYAHFTQWDYRSALPLLREYLRAPALTEYQRLVGQVNLCAALVHERHFEQAHQLLTLLLEQATSQRHVLLQANLRELCAQLSILEGDWEATHAYLQDASSDLKDTHGLDAFYIRKWQRILDLMKSGATPQTLGSMDTLKREASRRENWETIRHLDFFAAIRTENSEIATRLYFGTPFCAFNHRLIQDFGPSLHLPPTYAHRLGPAGIMENKLEISLAEDSPMFPPLKAGQLLHRLLCVLSSDFYRPFRLATLFSSLYPGESYHPTASPLRIHQLMIRLRGWCRLHRIPLQVSEQRGLYRLTASVPMSVTLSQSPLQNKGRSVQLRMLKAAFEGRSFSVEEARLRLEVSSSTTLRALQEARQNGILRREGHGKRTRYYFCEGACA